MMTRTKQWFFYSVAFIAFGLLFALTGCVGTHQSQQPTQRAVVLPPLPPGALVGKQLAEAPARISTLSPQSALPDPRYAAADVNSPGSFGTAYGLSSGIGTRADGFHALPHWEVVGPFNAPPYGQLKAFVWVWGMDPDATVELPLDTWEVVTVPTCELLGDRLILADEDWRGIKPYRISEFQFSNAYQTNLVLVNDTWIGSTNGNSQTACSVRLADGACAFFSVRHYTSQIAFDSAYRSPSGVWATNYFEFTPVYGQISSSNWTATQTPDGVIWIFVTRDSSQTIALIRLREANGNLVMVDYKGDYLSEQPIHNGQFRDGPLSPQFELPCIVSRWDDWNKRIVLFYQGADFNYECSNYLAHPVLAAVGTNKVATLIATLPEWVERVSAIIPFTRPDGAYWLIDSQVLDDCSSAWRMGKGGNEQSWSVGYQSASSDGWVFFTDATGSHLMKLPLPPLITFDHGLISWDQRTTADVLQVSSDLKTWSDSPTKAVNIGRQFYRVKQTW